MRKIFWLILFPLLFVPLLIEVAIDAKQTIDFVNGLSDMIKKEIK